MNAPERAQLLLLAAKELEEAVSTYDALENSAKAEGRVGPRATYNDRDGFSREAIRRRVITMRQHLKALDEEISSNY